VHNFNGELLRHNSFCPNKKSPTGNDFSNDGVGIVRLNHSVNDCSYNNGKSKKELAGVSSFILRA
jgi:hypothetical protein